MKPIVLGPKYAIRLGDLKPWHIITVKCWRCPRKGLVDPEDLRDWIDDRESIIKIEDRFRCKGCGNKVFNSWQVMDLEQSVND